MLHSIERYILIALVRRADKQFDKFFYGCKFFFGQGNDSGKGSGDGGYCNVIIKNASFFERNGRFGQRSDAGGVFKRVETSRHVLFFMDR